jgi:hypothetical protein
MVLSRPDGYVGFHSERLAMDKLWTYLATLSL